MFVLLDRMLKQVVRTGALYVTDAANRPHGYGDGSGPPVRFRLTDSAWETRIALDPDLHIGEAYMAGAIEMEQGTIYDLMELVFKNLENRPRGMALSLLDRLRITLRVIDQYNPIGKAQRNIAHHYDLSGELYDLFLDRDRQYSCAYFEGPDPSLEEAQLAKKRHLAAKLAIKPGMRVLDIGSGWGGLGLYLAEYCGAQVTGVTLSQEQHKLSNQRAVARNLTDRADFRLLDYRKLDGRFDRIVSVGMFEHVGVVHYGEFFRKCRALLADDGIAVLHSINRSAGPGATSAWIKKYIFPGGYIPALSEVLPHLEREGLYVTDVEILRLHYAQTLGEWRRRFAEHRDRAKALYDERFCRMWEYYLAVSETAFRYLGMNNFQIQFARSQHVLPMTRGYMQAEEDRLRALDSGREEPRSLAAE